MSPTTRKKTQRKVGDIIILVIFCGKKGASLPSCFAAMKLGYIVLSDWHSSWSIWQTRNQLDVRGLKCIVVTVEHLVWKLICVFVSIKIRTWSWTRNLGKGTSLTYQAFNIFWEIPLLCIERRRIIILAVRSHLKHANLQGDPRNEWCRWRRCDFRWSKFQWKNVLNLVDTWQYSKPIGVKSTLSPKPIYDGFLLSNISAPECLQGCLGPRRPCIEIHCLTKTSHWARTCLRRQLSNTFQDPMPLGSLLLSHWLMQVGPFKTCLP